MKKYQPEEATEKNYSLYFSSLFIKIKQLPRKIKIPRTKKSFFGNRCSLILVFIIVFSKRLKKQNDAKTDALFNSVYPKLRKNMMRTKFDRLNQNLAREQLLPSGKIISAAASKFRKIPTINTDPRLGKEDSSCFIANFRS